MSATNSYKVVTFTGEQAYAVARGLRARCDVLMELIKEAADEAARAYLIRKLADAQDALIAMSTARLEQGA